VTVDQENRDSQECKAREAHQGSLANGESLASRGRRATPACLDSQVSEVTRATLATTGHQEPKATRATLATMVCRDCREQRAQKATRVIRGLCGPMSLWCHPRRPGRSGPRAAATHQQRLRAAKAFWAWLIRREMALTNPWESVETIGKANAGKKQPREGDARLLDRHLFESAAAGDEGALALLVQLYLGLRPSEVLGLTVGGVEGAVVYVNGTKNKNAVRKLELYAPVAELLVAFCQGRPKSQRIFARDRPTQPTAGWMYKRLRTFCKRLQIPQICPHALRGLHSSLALAAGATSQHVAAALGHASFSTTSRHYATRESIEVGRARNFVSAMESEPVEALREALAQHGGSTTKQSEK
jgi:integrase